MSKEKPQSNNEAQDLAMARRALGRMKEMDFSPEEREQVMAMVDEAKRFEKAGNLSKALNVYTELLNFLKEKESTSEFSHTLVEYGDFMIFHHQAQVLFALEEDIAKIKNSADPLVQYSDLAIRQILINKGLKVEDGNIIKLDVSDLELRTLPDLNALKNLEVLQCQVNKLPKLPSLKKMVKLQVLECGSNQLNEVPDLSALHNLEILSLLSNNLTKLPDLSSLTNLTSLEVGLNPLEVLPDLSSLTKLEFLYCSHDLLDSLPDLSALKNLVQLECNYNNLTDLPDLHTLKNLRYLYCTHNALCSLPNLNQLENLEGLECSDNPINTLDDVSNLVRLQILKFRNTLAKSLPDLSRLDDLEVLDCSQNKLPITPEDLSGLKDLKEVHLGGCIVNRTETEEKFEEILPAGCEIFW